MGGARCSVLDKLTICRMCKNVTKKGKELSGAGLVLSWQPKGSRDERQGCCKFALLFDGDDRAII